MAKPFHLASSVKECYHCGKVGHIKTNCPDLQNRVLAIVQAFRQVEDFDKRAADALAQVPEAAHLSHQELQTVLERVKSDTPTDNFKYPGHF